LFYDAAVRGSDAIESRPGFANMLARIAGNGVRTIVVETANRFARDLMVQEVGFTRLKGLGVTLIAADSPEAFLDDGPTPTMVRQILGAVAQFDKAMTVAKLKAARDRKRAVTGKCGGRKSHQEANPNVVALAKSIAARGGRVSLRAIAAELEAAGYVNANGKQYATKSVMKMLA
jgi:DNA invertase Pin-like site-specific DNA recombinase